MRLFTAIELSPDILQRLERLLAVLRPEALIKWSPLDNLHITTKFIGEWPAERIDEMQEALSCLAQRDSFDLELKDLGWFPNASAPRVLWVGVYGGESLSKLAAETEHCVANLGVVKDIRPFSPHLTLARIKNLVPLERLRLTVEEFHPTTLGTFRVSHFSLFRSDPGPNASIYRTLKQFSFASATAAKNTLAARNT